MSQENVQVARALTMLWNQGERNVPTQYFDPGVTLESPFSSVSGEPYRGHAGIEQWVRDVDGSFSAWQNRVEDVRAVGDAVIVVGRLHGRARGSGIELEQPNATVMDFGSDHRIMRVRIFWDVSQGLKAVGLEE